MQGNFNEFVQTTSNTCNSTRYQAGSYYKISIVLQNRGVRYDIKSCVTWNLSLFIKIHKILSNSASLSIHAGTKTCFLMLLSGWPATTRAVYLEHTTSYNFQSSILSIKLAESPIENWIVNDKFFSWFRGRLNTDVKIFAVCYEYWRWVTEYWTLSLSSTRFCHNCHYVCNVCKDCRKKFSTTNNKWFFVNKKEEEKKNIVQEELLKGFIWVFHCFCYVWNSPEIYQVFNLTCSILYWVLAIFGRLLYPARSRQWNA